MQGTDSVLPNEDLRRGGERNREREREREREKRDVKNYYIIARAKEHVRAHVATRTHVHTHT